VLGAKHFAHDALAGLASVESFTSVQLKKSDASSVEKYQPFTDLMLLQIKGIMVML